MSEPAFKCWHCGSLDSAKPGVCNCAFCGRESAIGFISGTCGFCLGRIAHEKIALKLELYNIDPRDHRHWRYVRETTGGGHRVFDPVFPGEEPHGS